METSPDFTGPVNVSNPHEVTIRELAERIVSLVGGKASLHFDPPPQGDPQRHRPDISLARTALDWSPGVALDDGLKQTNAYFRHKLAA